VARWRIVTRLHRLACYLLKGSVASFWLCADDFWSSPTRRQIQSPSSFAFVPSRETYAPQQLAAHSITSSARASSGADRETKRLCRLQIGCQPEASRQFDRQVAQCSTPLLTTAPPRHSGQGPWRQDCPRRRCSDRAGTATTGTIGTVADGTTPTPQLASVRWYHRRPRQAPPHW
jgi:hypothetical protein